jgi:hypothetical protein
MSCCPEFEKAFSVQSSYPFTVVSAVFDGLLAHIPSGLFGANCAWLACAVIAHNLPAAGTLAGGEHAVMSTVRVM